MGGRLVEALAGNRAAAAPRDARTQIVVGVVPGEGVGPEVVGAAALVLERAVAAFNLSLELRPFDGAGLEAVCQLSEPLFEDGGALLCGPVGGRFVYDLRSRFDLFCKFTPVRPLPSLQGAGVLRPGATDGVDVVMVRENAGGLYFGAERVETDARGVSEVRGSYSYRRPEIERILGVALRAAAQRRRRLCLVVKPGGVEEMSRFWTHTLRRLARGSAVDTTVLSADHAAYRLVAHAQELDVVVSPNMLGDVLADCGGVLLGSRGMTYSGNFGDAGAAYQTGHGAAIDLAGADRANPVGQIGSAAMMLAETFGQTDAAAAMWRAVDRTLAEGWRTADIAEPASIVVGTRELGARIADAVEREAEASAVA
jgi:3-isopropylmalate dehydrogenase